MCVSHRVRSDWCARIAVALPALLAVVARADVRLPAILGDRMVLQQQAEVPLWGWAERGEEVRVTPSWLGRTLTATVDEDGVWVVRVRTPEAGGPWTIEIAGSSNTITLTDVLIGEVWLCAGQSNMEWSFASGVERGEEAVEAADDPRMRLFTVDQAFAITPRNDCEGGWRHCTPENVRRFSAVGYCFGQELRAALDVPVGLIGAYRGATRVEAWTSEFTLRDVGACIPELNMLEYERHEPGWIAARYARAMEAWWTHLGRVEPGTAGGWQHPDYMDVLWPAIDIRAHWHSYALRAFDGVIWCRSSFDAPAAWAGRDLVLELGPIDDWDTTWVNGHQVGGLRDWQAARVYRVPGEVIRAGRNVVAVRIVDTGGQAGFGGDRGGLRVYPDAAPEDALPLAGPWKCRTSTSLQVLPPIPDSFEPGPNTPSALFNGMIAPIAPFGLRGVIWYQGEANRTTAATYRVLFPAMIRDWREVWQQGDFPFYYAQIAPFAYAGDTGQAAQLRDAQRLALTTPNTGMAVTLDIGDPDDIHPRDKREVGRRLALWALAKSYGRDVACSGPLYRETAIEGRRVRLAFDHAEHGLVARGGLAHFEIADQSRRWWPAQAEIDGDTVVVWSEAVEHPTAVRYAWGAADEATLFNESGLPAASFTTQAWWERPKPEPIMLDPTLVEPAWDSLKLWYDAPADEWTEALPVGNGRLGAMVFGGVVDERIQLNEDTLWAGPPVPENAEKLAGILDEARKLFFDADPAAGERLVQERILAPRISPRSHQTLGDLRVRILHDGSRAIEPLRIADWYRGAAVPRTERVVLDRIETPVRVESDADRLVPEESTAVFSAHFAVTPGVLSAGRARLALGPIDDASDVYLNGTLVGRTRQWNLPHRFDVTEALREGDNLLQVVVVNFGGPGHMAQDVRLETCPTPPDYRRELDLDTAIATTRYVHDGVTFTREVLASPADDVIVVRMSADRPASIACDVRLDRPADFNTIAASDTRLVMSGQATHGGRHPGVRYHAVLDAIAEGGACAAADGVLRVCGADAVTLLLAAATDYNIQQPSQPLSRDRLDACDRLLRAAAGKPYAQLREAHVEEHQRLFRRASLTLGPNAHPNVPTDKRLRQVAGGAADPWLEALYFQFGRYLLISSSRPGSMPANLQGLWNQELEAPWNADYHLNINLQMNYWPAEVTNLAECHLPMIEFIDRLRPDGRELARRLGCGGFALGHETDAWLWTAVQGQCVWGMWPMAGGWCASHLMEHYRYAGDETFLREKAYPVLAEAAAFYLDWLVEDPRTGFLVSGPTSSPENTYDFSGRRLSLSMGTSIDQQIIYETFTNALDAADVLGIDDDFTDRIRAARARLLPIRVGRDGRLMEWGAELPDAEPGHRHVSPLYGLHPGALISLDHTPELAKAARATLDARLAHGSGHTGWSRAWLINFFARLRDANAAHESVRLLLANSTLPNLFDNHPPFQIDGNFGGTAGIAEMLLQSHEDVIHLLPALPDAWPGGTVQGLRARGGVGVDIFWQGGRMARAMLWPMHSGSRVVRYGDRIVTAELHAGQVYILEANLDIRRVPGFRFAPVESGK